MKRLLALLAAVVISMTAAAQAPAPADKPQSPLEAVEEILAKVSELSGIPIKHKVESEVVSREHVRAYIIERMHETSTPAEIHASEATLIKLGLLPAGFQLEKFEVDLLSEQATAFYDPKAKKFFLSDWAPVDIQKTAIAHELMHALQDQYLDLNEFMEGKNLNQDEQMARKSIVEGEGVMAMLEYMMAPMGAHVADVPDLAKTISDASRQETMKFPVFAAAPPYLRETLLFPYTAGFTYSQFKAKDAGKGVYAMLLKTPPKSTHEVLHAEVVGFTPTKPTPPVPPAALIEGYKKLDSNTLGELDIYILIKELVSEKDARAVSPAWRGMTYDVYENAAGKVLLAHRSQWKDAASARLFADAYRKAIAKKGGVKSTVDVHEDTVDVVEP